MASRRRTRKKTPVTKAAHHDASPPDSVTDLQLLETARHQVAFLEFFAKTGNVTESAEAAGIGRRTHYTWLQENESYRDAFEDALQQAADRLESVARQRAVDGLVQYQFTKDGAPLRHPVTGDPYFEVKYDTTLLIFLLKGLRPEKFKERHEHTGPKGGAIPVEHALVVNPLRYATEEELSAIEQLHERINQRALEAATPAGDKT